MAEELVFKARVDADGRSLQSLRQEFKALQKELDGTKVGTEKYIQTLKKLGEVKDEIGDLNQTINAFHPEGKIQAIQNVVGGLASGFQAATAATALFGDENEDLTKTLVKVQSAMAFADGIKGVMDLKDSFAVLNAVIAANPVTAFIVGLTAAVAVVYELVNAEEDLIEKEKERQKIAEENLKIDQQMFNQFRRGQLQKEQGLKNEIEILKASGASQEAIYKKEKELVDLRVANIAKLKRARIGDEKEIQAALEIALEEQALVYMSHYKDINDTSKKSKDKRVKNNKEAFDRSMADLDRYMAEAEGIDAIDEKNKQKKLDRETKYRQDVLQGEADWEKALRQEALDDEKRKAQERAYFEATIQTQISQSISSTMRLADVLYTNRLASVKKGSAEETKIMKQQFNTHKALAMTQATIDGVLAIQKVYSQGGVYGWALAIVQAGLTAANLAAIASQKFEGGGGGTSTGGGNTAAISTGTNSVETTRLGNMTTNPNVISGQPNGNVIDTGVQTQSQTIPVRAYVVESDISTSQANARTIRQRAAFS